MHLLYNQYTVAKVHKYIIYPLLQLPQTKLPCVLVLDPFVLSQVKQDETCRQN